MAAAPLLLLALLARGPQAPDREELLARCADCHPSESAGWARTGMSRALEAVRPGELAGLAPVADPGSGFVYAFEGDGADARVVETFPAASEPWRAAHPVACAIGAGELDRSYAVARGGRLFLAPLEVVREGGERRAALAPSHAIGPGTRFGFGVTRECLGCHTDAPPPADWPLELVPAGWEPRGISCAACHGDLAEHVAAREAELAGADAAPADPLAAQRPGGRIARMERCAACHLQGDARIELDPARIGPPPPGTPLLDTRAVFVAREPGDEIGFVSHVQRLVLSRCYLDSADFPGGGLSCETCHDPHRTLFEPAERARVRAACLACHETPEGDPRHAAACALEPARREGADCAACHMRTTGVFDVAKVAIHDHRIARRPPPPSPAKPLRFPESPTGDWRLFEWPDAPGRADADDPGPWTMALAHGGHVERALAQLRRGEGERARGLPMLHHVRGSLLERAGDLPAARRAYERALALDPDLAPAAINLAPLLARAGEPRAALALLDGVIARHPRADTAHRNRAVVRLALGDVAGFRADVTAALRLLPDAALALALARFEAEAGDAASAQRWRLEARALDPRVE